MEWWKVGILGLADEIHFYIDGADQKIKSDHVPLFTPNIPFFHYSMGYVTVNTTALG